MAPRPKGSGVHITLPNEDMGRLAEHAGKRTRAASKLRSVQDVARELVRFALNHVRGCAACSAGLPCDVHAPKEAEPEPTSDKPVEGWQALVDCYHDCHVAAGRGKPVLVGQDFVALRKLAEACGGADGAIDLIKRAFQDSFWAERITVQDLARNPGRGQTANGKRAGQATTMQKPSGYSPEAPKP